MLKRSLVLTMSLLLGVVLYSGAFALEAQTVGPLSFYSTEGDLEVIVKATHPGNATGKQPSVEWTACTDPSDGFYLAWEDPSPQDQWVISEVTVSAVNEANLYKYDGDWDMVDNPSVFSALPSECFKAVGGSGNDEDDIVNSWEILTGKCDPCGDDPAVEIIPVDNPCTEDYWTFKFDVENCENLCSMDVIFDIDCDVCGGTGYGIWKLLSEGDQCTSCDWEYVGGVHSVEETVECPPEYVCTLTWELTSTDYNFCCGFEEIIFGIGPIPEEEGPDFSDEGIIVVGEEPDQYMVGWTLNMEKCEESPDIAGSVTFEPVNPDPDYTGDEEAFFFSLDLENPENICSLDLCLYGKGEDGVCSLEDEKSLFWFQEAISEWTELEVTYEVGTFVVGEETFCEMLCVHFPQGGITPADLDEFMVIFGVDDGETDIFIEPVVPGPDDPDEPGEPGDDDTTEKSSGGGGCNVGTSASAILIAIPLLMVLFLKR